MSVSDYVGTISHNETYYVGKFGVFRGLNGVKTIEFSIHGVVSEMRISTYIYKRIALNYLL